jgi:hypothetical protein
MTHWDHQAFAPVKLHTIYSESADRWLLHCTGGSLESSTGDALDLIITARPSSSCCGCSLLLETPESTISTRSCPAACRTGALKSTDGLAAALRCFLRLINQKPTPRTPAAAAPRPAPRPTPRATVLLLPDDLLPCVAFVGVGVPPAKEGPVVGGRLVAVVTPVAMTPPLEGVTDVLVAADTHSDSGGIVATALVTARLKTDVASVSLHSQPPKP